MKTETCKQTDKSRQRKVLGLPMGGEDSKYRFWRGCWGSNQSTNHRAFLRCMVISLMEFSHLILDTQHSVVCYEHWCSLITPPQTFKKHVIRPPQFDEPHCFYTLLLAHTPSMKTLHQIHKQQVILTSYEALFSDWVRHHSFQ